MYTIEQLRDINAEMLDYAIKMLIESSLDLVESTADEESPVYDVPSEHFYRMQENYIESLFDQLDTLNIDYTEEYNAAEALFLRAINESGVNVEKIVEVIGHRAFIYIIYDMRGDGCGTWEWDELKDERVSFGCYYVDCYNILVQIGECYSYHTSCVA